MSNNDLAALLLFPISSKTQGQNLHIRTDQKLGCERRTARPDEALAQGKSGKPRENQERFQKYPGQARLWAKSPSGQVLLAMYCGGSIQLGNALSAHFHQQVIVGNVGDGRARPVGLSPTRNSPIFYVSCTATGVTGNWTMDQVRYNADTA